MKKYFTRIISFLGAIALLALPHYASAQPTCGPGETGFTYCYTFGEVNTVAFEVCPSAGMIAEADITQGTFDPFFPNTLTVYQGASGSGTGGTIVFGPTGGTPMGTFSDVSGNTITSTVADECLIFVINTVPVPGFDCATGSFLAVEACGRSLPSTTVNFIPPGPFCANAGVQAGLGGGTPTGGVYSGDGVTDDGNGTTFSFDPAGAGVIIGNNSVTYTNGGSASGNIRVIRAPSFTAPADICVNAAPVTLVGGSPSGGTYSGPGVVGNTFNPGLAGIGMHTLTYTTTCGSVTDNVEVLDCGCPVGAGFTTYFYCYDNFEADNVAFEVCPSAGMAAQATIVQGTFEVGFDQLRVYEGTSGSGTSGSLIFGPQNGNLSGSVISGTGADNCLIFVIDSDNVFSCADGDQTGLQACGEDIAPGVAVNFLPTQGKVCLDGGTVVIGGGSPTGGVYSGDGVVDNGNGNDFTFDPMGAGVNVGNNPVTYTTNTGSAVANIMVINLMVTMDDPPGGFCPSDGPQFLSNFGSPPGGIYSGTGITDLGDGINFLFNPMAAGEGSHVVTYSLMDGNGCSDSDNATFTVALPNVGLTDPGDFCIDAGVQTPLGGGTPQDGVYSGDGVMDDGNGMTYSFDPMAAMVGTHTITYTYEDPMNGCVNTATVEVEVLGLPMITCPADITQDNAPGQCDADVSVPAPNVVGGCFGTTVTNDYNGTADASDNYPVGATTVTFTVTDGNGNTATCSMTVTVEDNEPPSITCPADVFADSSPGQCGVTLPVTSQDIMASDNCGIVYTKVRIRETTGGNIGPWSVFENDFSGFYPVGTYEAQWRVKDAAGNMNDCNFNIQVNDNEAPEAACLDATINFNGEDEIFLTEADVFDEMNSTDNCGTVNFVSATPASVTCDQIGTVVPVTVVVQDGAGNMDQCIANVEVGGLPCGFSFDPDGINCPDGNTADYDAVNETFTITSEGCYDPAFYSPNDSHGFIQTDLCGDGEIIAEITDVTGNGWAGITMRETLLSGSKMLQLMIDGSFLTMRELRQSTGGIAFAHQFQTNGKNWLRLTRSGNIFGAYHSTDGVNWSAVLITQIQMSNCIYIGLVTANKAPSGSVTGTFANVGIMGGGIPLSSPEQTGQVDMIYQHQPEVSIYPNPSTGETFVDLDAYLGQKANIRIFNSAGQLVDMLEIDEVQIPTQRLEMNQYQNGLYLIQIQAEGFEMVTKKLTLMK